MKLPLDRDQFRTALKKGLGRALLHVREYGDAELGEDILDACLHNHAYDPQVEGNRVKWLLSILNLTPNKEFYRRRIIESLEPAEAYWDMDQLFDFSLVFAEQGYEPARRELYRKFDRQQFKETWLGGAQIVALDGMAGLFHVLRVRGQSMAGNPEDCEDDLFLRMVGETLGEEKVRAALTEQTQTNPDIRTYLDRVKQCEEKRDSMPPASPPTVEDILAEIEAANRQYPGALASFGRKFTDAEGINRLFAGLLAETRRDQLLHYLWFFRRRTVPRLDPHLFDLAGSKDKELQKAVINVLSNMRDPAVRSLAVNLLAEMPSSVFQDALGLLIENYQPGDHQLIEPVLPEIPDAGLVHGMGFDILNIAEKNPLPELARCLLWLYEHTPCSNCRAHSVENLIELNQLPNEVRQECLSDCSERIRELAEKGLMPDADE